MDTNAQQLRHTLHYIKQELDKATTLGLQLHKVEYGIDKYSLPIFLFVCGVCHAVEMAGELLGYDDLPDLDDLFRKWPEFSGSSAYPVPGPDYGDALDTLEYEDDRDAYYDGSQRMRAELFFDACPHSDYWLADSAYGQARRRLLDFCIAELDREYTAHEAGIDARAAYTGEVMVGKLPPALAIDHHFA